MNARQIALETRAHELSRTHGESFCAREVSLVCTSDFLSARDLSCAHGRVPLSAQVLLCAPKGALARAQEISRDRLPARKGGDNSGQFALGER